MNIYNIIDFKYQTKNWRKNSDWYNTGKQNECEKYQINLLENLLNITLIKTNERINTETINILDNKNPMIYENGYDYTENFDRKQEINNNIYYFNLKFVCDTGGAQTTRRE